MPSAQACPGHRLVDRPRRVALLTAVLTGVLFVALLGFTTIFDVDSRTQLIVSLVGAFGMPLLVGAILASRRRTRRLGLGVLGGVALGVPLTFVFMFWAIGVMASNIGS